jgi:hypothetical protein
MYRDLDAARISRLLFDVECPDFVLLARVLTHSV